MYQADLDSPCRELSNAGLGIVVAHTVFWENIFLSARIGRPIQLYYNCSKLIQAIELHIGRV